jgi:DNA-binding GntR family transcriptional regulator
MIQQGIIKDLKNAIARGTFNPGQRLIEVQLCKRYGVGRSRVREALKHLEQEGFVKIIPHTGAVVTELSQKDIEQIYDLMGTLEGLAMKVATPMINNREKKTIEKFIQKMEVAKNPFEFFQWNFKFHKFMHSLSGNDRLIKFIENLQTQAHRMSLRSFYNPGQIRASIHEHRDILNAIKEINPLKVEKAIRGHYLLSKNRLVKYLNKSL